MDSCSAKDNAPLVLYIHMTFLAQCQYTVVDIRPLAIVFFFLVFFFVLSSQPVMSRAYRLQRRKDHVTLYLATFKSGLKIVTLYMYYTHTTKAVVVTKCSNVLLPLLNFVVYTVYYWCYMPSSTLESISPRYYSV